MTDPYAQAGTATIPAEEDLSGGIGMALPSLAELDFEGVEEPEAPEPLPPVDFRIRLSPEKREEFARRLGDEIREYRQVVARRLDLLKEYRRNWEVLSAGTANRWDGCSDLPSHLTRVYCNSHQTRLNTQIINANPPFTAIARQPDAQELIPAIEDAMTAAMEEAEWPAHADDLHCELAVAGTCFLKTYWKRETARVPHVEVETDNARYRSLRLANQPHHEAAYRSIKKLQVQHETISVYDGVAYKVVPFEDGIILPGTVRRPEQCHAIGERYMVRGRDLKKGVEDGIYDEDAVNDLLERRSDPENADRIERLDDIGVDGMSFHDYDEEEYRLYEIHEIDWLGDWDGDGETEWAVCYLHEPTDTLVGLRWLTSECPGPDYEFFRYIIRPGELFGMGIAELVEPFHNADLAVQNQVIDHGDLALNWNGMFIAGPMAGIDPDKWKAALGSILTVQNINDLKPVPQLNFPQEQYTLRQAFKEACDILTATTNPGLGKVSEGDKTLGEVQIALGSANQIFEDYAARVGRTWARVADRTRWLLAQHGRNAEGEVPYRRAADFDRATFAAIPVATLKAAVDFAPTGMQLLADMNSRVQQAIMVSNRFGPQHPLMQGNWEALRIVDDAFLYALKFGPRRQLRAALDKQAAAMQAVQTMGALGGMAQPPGGPPPEAGAMPGAPPPVAGGPPPPLPPKAEALAGAPAPPLPGVPNG